MSGNAAKRQEFPPCPMCYRDDGGHALGCPVESWAQLSGLMANWKREADALRAENHRLAAELEVSHDDLAELRAFITATEGDE